MPNNEIDKYNETTFDSIKHIDELGNEYWEARELKKVLGYVDWRKFEGVINKSKIACINSNYNALNHFAGVDKMIKIAKGARRQVTDYRLSRYACYLVVQNSDPNKENVALGQTYFAIKTREREISEKEYLDMTEDERRFYKRDKTRKANFILNQVAKKSGVKNFDKFHNEGYKGLYDGETADDIARRKGLRYREEILDNMGSEELAANEFRITQTEAKLKRDNINTEKDANKTHHLVGKKVRNTIKGLGGTMPENLSTPDRSLKELKKIGIGSKKSDIQ
jgi:DNA-damage-inducible protein D